MHIEETGIPGLLILTPARFGDARGFFSETWNRERLAQNGIDIDFVQDNHSLSATVGTVRGLHFQAPPHAQAKLVRCGRGVLFDVAVDIRKGSPTYGQWFGVELSFENGKQLLIPAGFAHGFATRAPETEIIYKCSDYYAPEARARCATTIRISGSTGASATRRRSCRKRTRRPGPSPGSTARSS
jgi:dTDP-4-dehydrorhamnose 3,5-epimerase